jgi:hypothetical protein
VRVHAAHQLLQPGLQAGGEQQGVVAHWVVVGQRTLAVLQGWVLALQGAAEP